MIGIVGARNGLRVSTASQSVYGATFCTADAFSRPPANDPTLLSGITRKPLTKPPSGSALHSRPCVGSTTARTSVSVSSSPAIDASPSHGSICAWNTGTEPGSIGGTPAVFIADGPQTSTWAPAPTSDPQRR